jgi:SH3-like domain-containing protein
MFSHVCSRRLSLILAIALMLVFCTPTLAEQRTVYAAVDDAIVYDIDGNTVATVPVNTALKLIGVKRGVCRVKLNGYTGYMNKSDLSSNPVTVTGSLTSMTVYVSRDGAPLYDAGRKVIGTLTVNTPVTVFAVRDGVCQVTANGTGGYMMKADLSAKAITSTYTGGDQETSGGVMAYVKKRGANLYDQQKNVIATLGLNVVVTVTAKKGNTCQVTTGDKSGYMSASDLSREKTVDEATATTTGLTPVHGYAREMDWWTSDIQTIFARGVIAQITDVETGLTWREKRYGGKNHADCQPLTAADTAMMKKAYGGKWSWDRRAVFVTINGVNYAASINGMPHGADTVPYNDMNGQICIHFLNSRTHCSDKVCPLHQAMVKKAYEAYHN